VRWFITGTDTGVGKTVLTALLTRHLHDAGRPVRAFKPLCSGDRADAEALGRAQGEALPLDVVNPWHFRRPVTPLLAARERGVEVTVAAVARHVRRHGGAGTVLLEGAGGLLSPLLADGDAPELLAALRARPVIVAVNRLGVLNQVRLVLAALPPAARARTHVVLMEHAPRDASTPTNFPLLTEFVGFARVHALPRLRPGELARLGRQSVPARLRPALDRLVAALDDVAAAR
jgi:dethiobiotin synthetase